MALIKLNNQSVAPVTTLPNLASLPSGIDTGKVLQIQRTGVSDTSTTSTSYTQIASINITPNNSSSKMYISYSFATGYIQSGGSNHNYNVTIYRDSTNLAGGGFNATNHFSDHNGHLWGGFSGVITDTSHNTTSQITYKIMARSISGSSFHLGKDDAHQSGNNEFVVMEIL